jgi:hypothetical protein
LLGNLLLAAMRHLLLLPEKLMQMLRILLPLATRHPLH